MIIDLLLVIQQFYEGNVVTFCSDVFCFLKIPCLIDNWLVSMQVTDWLIKME